MNDFDGYLQVGSSNLSSKINKYVVIDSDE